MTIDRIFDMRAFVAVIDHGGISAAARHLDRSIQSVSRSLAAVERSIGVQLVHRTTRSSQPTEAGLDLSRRLSAALADIDSAVIDAAEARSRAIGILKVSASARFAGAFIVPAVAAFLEAHPSVEVQLDLSDRFVDLVKDGFDVAIRIGAMPDSTYMAKRVAGLRRVTFAAPPYLAREGVPRHPLDLAAHQCIVRTASRDGASWPFEMSKGTIESVRIGGRFKTSGADAANQAAVLGLGIGNAPLWQVRSLVVSGALKLLLTEFEPPEVPVHAVWAAGGSPPAKIRLFVELLASELAREPL